MTRRPTHPAAELFPLLDGIDFESLVADVRLNGLREAIWLDAEDRVLDGRNRLRACAEAGVEPRFCIHDGGDPVGFVLSQNLHRRHLSESQRAMIAARMADMSQGARTDISPEGGRLSQADAAARCGVGARTVPRAKIAVRDGEPPGPDHEPHHQVHQNPHPAAK